MNFQTRDIDGELRYFNSINEALNYAKESRRTVWKISFTLEQTKEMIRLIRTESGWTVESVFGNRDSIY